ncbi:MAG: tetraacyldisaccharide 4'-kinase [Gemmatimonadota bacterium]
MISLTLWTMPRDLPGDSLRRWVPRWWRGEAGAAGEALGWLLLPAEAGYRVAVAGRGMLYDAGLRPVRTSAIPVISVGNLTVGGTGKTPMGAFIAGKLCHLGRLPGVVLRGYGRDEIEVHRELNPGVPVYVSAHRADGVRAAAGEGCDCAVLDDAFQHRALARDLDVVLVAAEQWAGPRRMLPRGPWRESSGALDRADFVVVTRKVASTAEASAVRAEIVEMGHDAFVGVALLRSASLVSLDGEWAGAKPLEALRESRVLAVSSLADPVSFAGQLDALALDVELMAFPDHHEFTPGDIARITQVAARRTVVMTRKEAVKLRGRLQAVEALVLEQEVDVEVGLEELDRALQQAVEGAR